MRNSLLLLIGVFLSAGCGRDEITTYRIRKEEPSAPAVQRAEASMQSAAVQESAVPSGGSGFSADIPAGWTEKPGSGMRIVSYSIEGTGIDFYLISLAMGDVPSNVNRWRGQIGLVPASPEEIASEVQVFQADGRDVSYIELYNPDSDKGIIAAIVDLSPEYWYFTAKGSAEELQANAGDIRSFLRSLRMGSAE